jgi:parallel beta-helix repeat protein
MYKSTNNTVEYNNASNNQNYHGISLEESNYNYILNNTARSNLFQGIYIGLSSYNTVYNNTLTFNGNNGIYLNAATYNKIMNNNASNNLNFHGISIDNDDFNLIMNNVANSNNLNGIYIDGAGNVVKENEIMYNAQEGVSIMGLSNVIARNNISSNLNGIRIFGGIGGNYIVYNNITSNLNVGFNSSALTFANSIYGNNFISNTILHAYDEMWDNWNDTCGGNYWDDWTGPDADTNGIVDIPRDIPGVGNQDLLPLTTPAVYRHPLPPTNISIELEGASFENVNITWNLSVDENLCFNKVWSYAIFYSSVYDREGKDYQLLAGVSKGKSYYVHSNAGRGDPESYFYIVQVTSYGYLIRNETQVAKFNRDLDAGMHMISIPLILENKNIDSVLQTLDFGVAWYYNNSDQLNPWKSYNKLKANNDLKNVNRSMALYVDVLSDSNFTIAGVVPDSTDIPLRIGWNFVGYPSFIERNISESLSAIAYERIEGYSQSPPQFLRIYNDNDLMKPGFGYWVKVSSDDVWTLMN